MFFLFSQCPKCDTIKKIVYLSEKGGLALSKKRIWLWLLGTLLLAYFLMVAVEASDKLPTWGCLSEDSLWSPNATLSTDENGYLDIRFTRTAPLLSAEVARHAVSSSKNAIRLCVTNYSACNSILLTYWYSDRSGEPRSATEKLAIGARGVRNDYYIYTDSADRITDITITFSAGSSGRITVSALDFVSIYDDTEDACGTVTSCVYDQANSSVTVSGNVNYEIVTAHRKARLVLYAVDMNVTSLPYGSIPLASVPMSSHFDFSVPKVSVEERLRGYVVAVVSEGGEILYTFSPRVPISKTEDVDKPPFFKGVHTDFGILAARANAGLSVIDVDFAKLTSPNVGEGILHAFGGRYFYFNRQYLSSLDWKIQKSYENGMLVVLRFTSSAPSDTEFSSVLAHSDEDLFRLYAYTEFLCSRYSSHSRGIVTGIALGTAADAVPSQASSMIQYTQLYADSLLAVYEAAASANRSIQLIVPISDHLEAGKAENILFSPRVFLTSLGKILDKRYVGGLCVNVMVESNALSGEGSVLGQLGFEHIQEFSEFLGQLHDSYPSVAEQYLYYWEPVDTQDREYLKASLLHGYYTAACEKDLCGFVFSTSYIYDISLGGELMHIFRLADSSLGQKNSEHALGVLKKGNWQELIDGYSEKIVQTVEYRENVDATTAPFRFLGTSYLWDFSSMRNDDGWSMGDGCESLVMEKNEETDRALVAKMTPSAENNYESELIYRFSEEKSFVAVDALSFVIRVDAPAGNYRVTVQVCGEHTLSEAQLSLSVGELSTLYVNTSDLFMKEGVRCIRIFTTPVSGSFDEYTLSIGSISAHSTTHGSEALENRLKATQSTDIYEDSEQKIAPVWIYTIGFLAFVSIMVVVALAFRNDEEI